jgi:hypothetical protein
MKNLLTIEINHSTEDRRIKLDLRKNEAGTYCWVERETGQADDCCLKSLNKAKEYAILAWGTSSVWGLKAKWL